MPDINLTELTIVTAHKHLIAGDFSAVELAEAYLAEIEKKNPELNAYLEVFSDVREQAKAADARIKAGTAETLTGIPIAVKDNILIEGRTVTAASKILEGYVAPYDATAIKKLKAAGVVFLGRTNMDEFAMGTSTENSAFGPTKNPHDLARVPGGTSGGSAAAVAANMALAALGSDTGGSVRQPASLCGVVGFKPTYGAVSRSGLIAMTSSFDVIGALGKRVEDTECLFSVIRGHDPLDSTSFPEGFYQRNVPKRAPATIGVPFQFIEGGGIDADVLRNFKDSLKQLEATGMVVRDVALPFIKYALPVYYIICPAEVSTNLARFDGVKYGVHKSGPSLLGDYVATRSLFGMEARRRILLGAYVLSSGYYDAYYRRANELRACLRSDFSEIFDREGINILATPTSPTPAFLIGEKSNDPLALYLADIFTVTANIVGIPAISIPSGFVERDGKKLPLGLQLMAAQGREDMLFETGKLFETVQKK